MNKQKSFTLIELLVVIVIIGILAGVIMISTSSSIDKANLAKAQVFSKTVQNELLSGLVSEWTFDTDAVSGKTEDTWGCNDGTVYEVQYKSNATKECVFGGCYSFNGTVNSYIDCGSHTSLKNKNSTITIWFNSNDLNGAFYSKYLIGNGGDYNNAKGFGLTTGADSLTFWVGANVLNRQNQISTSVGANNWHFAVATYQVGAGSKLYLNGVIKNNSNSFTGDIVYDTCSFLIGKLYSNYYFYNGLIDDTRIYNTVMSSSQIKQNYIAGLDSLLSKGSISKEDYNQRINELAYEE